ncbi:MAG TPA: ABC transporter substrate-binding protein [Burkholderiales bacterium]|nr:ABC transporter substrate-binding protein [Burkholderiales bacterium]
MHPVLLSVFSAMLFAWSLLAAAAVPEAPDQLVRRVANEVLTIARENPDLQGDAARVARLIEQKIVPHFDFERITRLAVGRPWRQATASQREQLISEFRRLLVRSYSAAYTTYKEVAIEVEPLKLRPEEDDVTVRTRIKRTDGGPPIEVDYSMFKTDSQWKVYDVAVEGVSLVTTYRSTFAQVVNNGGIAALIDRLVALNTAKVPPKPAGISRRQ